MRKREREQAIAQELWELLSQIKEVEETAETYDLLWINLDTILIQTLKALAEPYLQNIHFWTEQLIQACTNARIDYTLRHSKD